MISSISSSSGGLSSSFLKQIQEDMFKAVDSNGDSKIDKTEMSSFQKSQQENGRQGGPSVDEMFTKMDSDNDGAISRLESDAAIAKMSQEMRAQGPPPASGKSEKRSSSELKDNVFNTADQNGDGSISEDELNTLLGDSSRSDTTVEELMSALDTDKDGSISKSESDAAVDKAEQQRLAQGAHPPPPPPESSSSSPGRSSSSQIFDALDTDKDGTVSASELLAALSSENDSESESSSSSSGSTVDSSSVKKIFDAMDTNQDGTVSKSELEAALAKKTRQHQVESTADNVSSTSTAAGTNSTDPTLYAAAAKSYLQASFSSFAENAAASALSASALYA